MARICLIELDTDFADCLKNILESEGFDVAIVGNINSAVATIEHFDPSLTIIDIHDGGEISIDQIESIRTAENPMEILVTANYKTPELACKAVSAGASDFLLKPFSTTEIIEKVRNLAGSDRAKDSDIEIISSSISNLSSLNDILNFTLDQLVKSLNLADCIICSGRKNDYTVLASRGYSPDPTGRSLKLSSEELHKLLAGCDDPLYSSTALISGIIDQLDVTGHRPFPILMPLVKPVNNGDCSQLIGFVMGHGAIVIDETDILEMEQFLSRVSVELSHVDELSALSNKVDLDEISGEYLIPDSDRELVTSEILETVRPFLSDSKDEFWIRLVLDEAVNNAILHGHGESLDNPRTNLILRFTVNPTELVLVVEDRGDGFNVSLIPDPTSDENLMSINGRGIYLMRNIMDSVTYNEKGNMVTMAVRLGERPIGPVTPDIFGGDE